MKYIEVTYLILSLISFILILRKKRPIDLLTVGFLSQQVYFMPLIFQAFGFSTEFGPYSQEVVIFGLYLVIIFLFFSFFKVSSDVRVIKPIIDTKVFCKVAFFLSLLGFVAVYFRTAGAIFYLPKSEMLKLLGYDYVVWSICTIMAVASSYYLKEKLLLFLSSILLLINIYIGFRSPAAITFISVTILFFDKNRLSIFDIKKRYVLSLLFFVFFFFVYKGFYMSIKSGNFNLLAERSGSVDYILGLFLNSEPSVTLSILTNVLAHDVRIGVEHAQNILISIGFFGWMELNVQNFIYVLSLHLLSNLISSSSGVYKYVLTVSGAYWGFYIHRNDLAYQITLEKRVFICFIMVSLVALFLQRVRVR